MRYSSRSCTETRTKVRITRLEVSKERCLRRRNYLFLGSLSDLLCSAELDEFRPGFRLHQDQGTSDDYLDISTSFPFHIRPNLALDRKKAFNRPMTANRPVTLSEHASFTGIQSAAERLRGTAVRTPLIRLPFYKDVYAKAESLQLTGSFKLRGAYNFLASLDEEVREEGVVAFSSGNHAQGVACAAHLFGVAATIVIPDNAPDIKVRRTEAWGAEVVRCESRSGERERVARELAQRTGKTLVPPFDHPWIIEGQGTVGLEIAEDLPDVANVLVCLGGGGLLAGIATSIRERCPNAQIIGVEPELAADGKASFDSGTLQTWDVALTARTVADGVRTQRLGEHTFAIIKEKVAGVVTVSEAEILAATRDYLSEVKLVVEPTGAIALAAYRRFLEGPVDGLSLQEGPSVLLVSGGNADPVRLAEILCS